MATLKTGQLFNPELVTEMFDKVKGHSALAVLSNQTPIPFSGSEIFVFNLEGNAQIVGEGEKKEAGEAKITSKTIKPVKIVYQTRVSDEFMYCAEEKKLQYMNNFANGFAVKIAEAFDIAAIHGLEPKTLTDASFKSKNSFDGLITENITVYDAGRIDENLEAAVEQVLLGGGVVTGLALSPNAGSALGKVKVNGVAQYPEFKFGGKPQNFAGMKLDVNRTLTINGGTAKKDHAIVGDFDKAFKWGYAENVPMEVIEYGDPDQTGKDLKAHNEVCLRAEAYIGWGILDEKSFAMVQEG
ncbi:phage major capsid protein [Helcococcus bovis]|uniref:phage major capsid family protein n=1 Tax=Helcococcus bovis TaxID=3153252 RepID=UPI0038BDC01E